MHVTLLWPLLLLTFAPALLADDASTKKWDGKVLDLMRLDRREVAFSGLLKQAKYPPNAAYQEKRDETESIKEVVLCPQAADLPIFAVFLRSKGEPAILPPFLRSEHGSTTSPNRSGHIILISADGTIIPVYSGANSLKGRFEDMNDDGILDFVHSWLVGFDDFHCSALHVIPVTLAQQPVLQIFYDEERLSWRAEPSPDSVAQRIQLGRKENGSFAAIAEFTWSPAAGAWEGPEGGPGHDFIRVKDDEKAAAATLQKSIRDRKTEK